MSLTNLIIPEKYAPILGVRETQKAIKSIKDNFQKGLAKTLDLDRISAPLFLRPESGLNDNLNGVERPVKFDVKEIASEVEVVHSLAKWKRHALNHYNFKVGHGLYTDMNAIRRDEDLDNLHSIYVDQWDWEKIIEKQDRNINTLKETVKKIYTQMRATEMYVCSIYPQINPVLPVDIFFITSQDLLDMYPNLTPKERENKICKDKGAVFVMQIGDKLSNGEKHDGRAPDYDDWQLNGDILVWYELLNMSFELSSMGIRVDEDSLVSQLDKSGCKERLELPYHKAIVNKELPYTIGGGIGQSRLCMFYLRKAHIGEVRAAIWADDMIEVCENNNIKLL